MMKTSLTPSMKHYSRQEHTHTHTHTPVKLHNNTSVWGNEGSYLWQNRELIRDTRLVQNSTEHERQTRV